MIRFWCFQRRRDSGVFCDMDQCHLSVLNVSLDDVAAGWQVHCIVWPALPRTCFTFSLHATISFERARIWQHHVVVLFRAGRVTKLQLAVNWPMPNVAGPAEMKHHKPRWSPLNDFEGQGEPDNAECSTSQSPTSCIRVSTFVKQACIPVRPITGGSG